MQKNRWLVYGVSGAIGIGALAAVAAVAASAMELRTDDGTVLEGGGITIVVPEHSGKPVAPTGPAGSALTATSAPTAPAVPDPAPTVPDPAPVAPPAPVYVDDTITSAASIPSADSVD